MYVENRILDLLGKRNVDFDSIARPTRRKKIDLILPPDRRGCTRFLLKTFLVQKVVEEFKEAGIRYNCLFSGLDRDAIRFVECFKAVSNNTGVQVVPHDSKTPLPVERGKDPHFPLIMERKGRQWCKDWTIQYALPLLKRMLGELMMNEDGLAGLDCVTIFSIAWLLDREPEIARDDPMWRRLEAFQGFRILQVYPEDRKRDEQPLYMVERIDMLSPEVRTAISVD